MFMLKSISVLWTEKKNLRNVGQSYGLPDLVRRFKYI